MSLVTGNNSIDSLIHSSWNVNANTPVSLTYSFLSTVPSDASADDRNGFRPMNALQQQAVRDAMAKWAAVANITFTEVSSGGKIQLATNIQSDSAAYAYLPEHGVSHVYLYTSTTESYNLSFPFGGYGASVLLHELGHNLGLKHPGDYNSSGDPAEGPFLPSTLDNGDYTQMSYHDSVSTRITGKYATTPMMLDIQAMQYLYGANMSYHTGDDVYKFTSSIAPSCIWDAGGYNIFDFSPCTTKVQINLGAGTFSETAPGLNNVSIAYGVSIRSAIAGSGGSNIIGNDLGDTLTGGGGADRFQLGKGNDIVSGNGGDDVAAFNSVLSHYALLRVGDNVTVIGDGIDQLQGVETLAFADGNVTIASIAESSLLAGTDGNDVLTARFGALKVDGGAGIDLLNFNGSSSDYSVRVVPGAVVVQGNDGVSDVLTGVERVHFNDGYYAVDTLGSAGSIYRLYQATFARVPDDEGMGTWLNALDKGTPLEQIVTGFLQSDEFFRVYGRNLSDADFVTLLYNNVLHRAPEAAGFNSHLANLAAGATREHVLVAFSESVELIANLVGVMPNEIRYLPHVG